MAGIHVIAIVSVVVGLFCGYLLYLGAYLPYSDKKGRFVEGFLYGFIIIWIVYGLYYLLRFVMEI